MKRVIWTDGKGYKHASLIRDSDDPSLAPEGIRCDPPDLDQLNWKTIRRELHNALVERGLSTWEDVQRSQNGVTSTILGVLRRPIIALYRAER